MELLIIVILSLLLVPLVVPTLGGLRIALGLACVLFFPGYTLSAALFPKRGDVDGIERLALGLGLNIAVVPLIGLVLNYTPWGICSYSLLISLSLFIIVMATIAWYRRRRLPPEKRFDPQFGLNLSSLFHLWTLQSRWDKVLTVLLLAAIMGAAGTLAYVVAKPKAAERFTEFYVLGSEGTAEGYPRKVLQGENVGVVLGIVNREHETAEYEVEVTIDGEKLGTVGPITLNREERWEQEVIFTLARAKDKQKVEFLLYKGASTEPHRGLHLWMDVGGAPEGGR